MKCCDKIDDDWINGDMWHDSRTTFGFTGGMSTYPLLGKLFVTYQCPHCDKIIDREFLEVKA
tara:strand:+ start:944 stop:1129 length:186 start_codon:yes stop_codon:yes gene_type:complete